MWDDDVRNYEIDDAGPVGLLSIGRQFHPAPNPDDGIVAGVLQALKWQVAAGVSAPTSQRVTPTPSSSGKWWAVWTRGNQSELGNLGTISQNTVWSWNSSLPDVDGSIVVMKQNAGPIAFDYCP